MDNGKWICSTCGKTNPSIDNFCENCGTAREVEVKNQDWICSTCGKTNPSINNFCENCGTPKIEVEGSNDRLIEKSNPDGSTTIIDNENGYTIDYTKENGYIAHDKNGEEIYHIHPDGNVKIKTSNGEYINIKNDAIDIGTLKNNAIFTDEDDKLYTIQDGRVVKVEYIDETTNCKCVHDFTSGNKLYYDYNNKCFIVESPYGEKTMTTSDSSKYILKPDGTYSISSNQEQGTYIIDKDGNFVFKSSNGPETIYNNTGEKIKYIDIDGTVYDFRTNTQIITKNGKKTYSLINHIEYDEESYNKILTTLSGIGGSYKGNIISECSNIESAISSFPDSYSSSSVSSVESKVEGHTELISSLAEMTNYSLLAYQTCDEELKSGLYLLVDSLFGDGETRLANNFKNSIKSSIEDRDGDNILEYAENTNFKILSKNAIVDSTYIDNDNNKWYLNKNKVVIGVEGNNLKINYGGETFSVLYDENGIAKIKDSKGKSLNIFGDYNIESSQYGGNQCAFSNSQNYKLLNNESVIHVLNKYFPEASSEETQALFSKLSDVGCGFTAMGNIVLKKFEGQEESFYNTFGYPMYNVKLDDSNNLSIDYNYEPVTLDMFCHINAHDSIGETIRSSLGLHDTFRGNIETYLSDAYNVSLDGFSDSVVFRSEWKYDLYNMDGSIALSEGGPHAMVETGQIGDGKYVVSSWGKKYILDCTGDAYDSNFGQTGYKEYH